MFGSFGSRQVNAERNRSKSLPERVVTRTEFVAAMIANGSSQKDAEMHATINETFGSGTFTVIGEEKLSIAKANPA